ncbi:hypothetical protein VRU48_08120 [Pedobacter sp. KR3-3]|uniref:Bacteriocin n=1 Tax=Pedobacter albus TaxID=3113905 RepID=A0ABU7I758_9SPHI|nr:hypothetical protein [Pedobacter sp. KR3-3]MEE1945069.1 hypothetical protein [Pedobacter sp. KR3-3]
MKKANLLSKAEMKQVAGGVAAPGDGSGGGTTPEGCIVYSIKTVNGVVERRFMDEYGTAQEAQNKATEYATGSSTHYGYDCPDANGNYEHSYIWS